MLNRVDLTKYLQFDPKIEIDNFFNELSKDNEFIGGWLNTIKKLFNGLVDKCDLKTISSEYIYDMIRVIDKLCMVNSYHVSITVPSYIIMQYYSDKVEINFLEVEQITNDIRRVIENNSMSYDMEIDVINNIIKDLVTSGFFDHNIYHTDTVARDFDTKRTLATLMSRGVLGNHIGSTHSDTSIISNVCDKYIKTLNEYIKGNDTLEYDYICNIYDEFCDDLLRNMKGSVLKDLCLVIQSFFKYILYSELNPKNNEAKMTLLEVMSLLSKLSKESKYNPIVTITRQTIILILKDKNKSNNFRDFRSYTTSMVNMKSIKSTDVLEEFSCLVESILDHNNGHSIMENYVTDVPLTTNYVKQLISSNVNNVNESTSFGLSTCGDHHYVDVELSTLTEGFKVLNNGNIQLTFNRESSLMDEYSQNHRLLKYNQKLGNYEGMKYNLVYLLILIDTIESKVIYNSKMSQSDKDEAKKVVRLCKGDLGVYLPIIQQHDKSFDLNRFYKEVKTDNNTVEIDTIQTINGIKLIIKSIL